MQIHVWLTLLSTSWNLHVLNIFMHLKIINDTCPCIWTKKLGDSSKCLNTLWRAWSGHMHNTKSPVIKKYFLLIITQLTQNNTFFIWKASQIDDTDRQHCFILSVFLLTFSIHVHVHVCTNVCSHPGQKLLRSPAHV